MVYILFFAGFFRLFMSLIVTFICAKIMGVTAAIIGYMLLCEFFALIYEPSNWKAGTFAYLSNPWALDFWGGIFIVGIVIPLLIIWNPSEKVRNSLAWLSVAGILNVVGKHENIDLLGKEFGHVEREIAETDMVTFAFGIAFGVVIGLFAVKVGQLSIGLGSAGGLLTLGLIKTGFPNKISQGNVVRPPGALPEPEFLDRCVRCQECVKICSSTGAGLQPAFLESGWEGIWTPRVDARHGYCEYNCNLCGQVCPTGAIHPAELEVKQKKLRMGTAYFDRSRCIPWYKNEDCLVCEEHCPLPDKAIKFDKREVQLPNGDKKLVKFPYVVESLCIGCGICVTKCPVEGPGGIFLTNALEQRWENDM